ncbi:MAG TPA: hypothetical protein VG099_24830 [Gemmataceae bacterium]|nr:hypothetical protein [Gemmataceae bacterium]
MSDTPKIPAVAVVVLALGLAGCDKVAQGEGRQSTAPGTEQALSGKPATRSHPKESTAERASAVTLLRPPNGGIQPQALVDAKGTLHLLYFKGDNPGAGDLFYIRRDAGAERFSEPIRINSRPASACAIGSVRGGQMALGKGNRIHIVWNGLGTDYARLNDSATAFEEQRNLMRQTHTPDGGGTVAADDAGNVYVIWHGIGKGEQAREDKRKVWVARSEDEGKTFSLEAPVWTQPTGVCPCCSTRAFADRKGSVYLLYRSATAGVNRDIYLLSSVDRGQSFHESLVHQWKVPG